MRHPKINYQGKQLWLHEIAELNGINSFALGRHYRLAGDDIEKAVAMSKATQIGPRQYIDFFGKKMTITAIAKIYGINYHVLQRAYEATSDIDEAIDWCVNNGSEIYKPRKDTVSIHKLKKLAYTFDETRFKVDHTLLDNELDPIAIVDDKMLNENLKARMKTLQTREQQILRSSYGVEDGYCYTREELAAMEGVTTSRIGQIENRALHKLRHPKLTHYYDVRTEPRYSFVDDMKNQMSLFSLSEQRLLCLLYGLADGRYHSYPEIAKKFGLSVDRIKMLEKNLIQRLHYLSPYLSLYNLEYYRTELALNSGKERI